MGGVDMNHLRNFLFIGVLVTLFTYSPVSSFDLPDYVLSSKNMDEVKLTAKDKDTPVAFVYSDKKSKCQLAQDATTDLFHLLCGTCTVVYVPAKSKSRAWKALPDTIKAAIYSKDAGPYFPIVVITDADVSGIYEIIPYIGDAKKRENTVQTICKKYKLEKTSMRE